MALEFLLEEFAGTAPRAQGQPAEAAPSQATASQSYEQGYAAGWEDAVRAEEETRGRISSELALNLQDLGFTFHEARAHVMRAFEPLLTELVNTFVPEIARAALAPVILAELHHFADSAADTQVELLVPVGNASLIQPIVEQNATLPLRLTEEPSLAEGQALIRTQSLQRRIDLGEAARKVADALGAFYENKERKDVGT